MRWVSIAAMLSTVTAYVVRAQDVADAGAAKPVEMATPSGQLPNAVVNLQPPVGSSLAVVTTDGGYFFRLHGKLTIEASGAVATNIRTQYATTQPGKLVTLVLDGVPLNNLPYVITDSPTPGNVLLTFQLTRDSSDDQNRKAWDALLTANSYEMEVPVYLSIANGVAQVVSTGKQSAVLSVANASTVKVVSGGALLAIVLLLVLLVRSDWLRDGNTGYYSLGKSQMAFWGVIVFMCVIAVFLITGTLERIPPQTLGLLGISGATGLGSLLIGSSPFPGAKGAKPLRIELEALVKKGEAATAEEKQRITEISTLLDRRNFLKDITDDGNGTSFHRVQVVVWTVLLGVVFVRSVAAVMSMPEFPESLLLLMGISNATYLGFKFPEGSGAAPAPAPAPPAPPAPPKS